MQVVYFEHYPHMHGTMNARVVMSEEEFILLVALWLLADKDQNYSEDADELIEGVFEARIKKPLYAITSLTFEFKTSGELFAKVQSDLDKKGWYFGEWEEGSFYFCLEDYEKEAKAALIKRESEVLADAIDLEEDDVDLEGGGIS